MSETASFVDPVFLATFGLSRANVLEYFLHPLNPFKTSVNTTNDEFAMRNMGIGTLMQLGTDGVPLPPKMAEEEYHSQLRKYTGEQYELLPPATPEGYIQISPLYTIRHVHRKNPTSSKVLGIYYVLEGVIYKSPSIRSLMKANVARTLEGLSSAFGALSKCSRFQTSSGFFWVFEDEDDEDEDPVALLKLAKRHKRPKVLDNRRPGERTDAEEEGLRASEAIDRILERLSKSALIKPHEKDKKHEKEINEGESTEPPAKKQKI